MQATDWSWDFLRKMKVGGNESATKFFKANGASAALQSKDQKIKYNTTIVEKYLDEITRRAAADLALTIEQ